MGKVNIFLSYCQKNSNVADNIDSHFKDNQDIVLHRDMIDIKPWNSIKEYMQSITDMDYAILLISDEYLKSANCMYEVLEVMRDKKYKNRIFTAVINHKIYDPIIRANYIKYWENQFNELHNVLEEISTQNLGGLSYDLKRYQDISSNIADFLSLVSDMNNPNISDVSIRIEEKLKANGLIENQKSQKKNDLFSTLGIEKTQDNSKITDLEINKFLKESFKQIVHLLSDLCLQFEKENSHFQILKEQIDANSVIFQFYKNGQLVKGLKIFLGSIFGRQGNIGIQDNTIFFSGNNSWNGMYDVKVFDGELRLYASMSLIHSQSPMTVEGVVADIWKSYIQQYLDS